MVKWPASTNAPKSAMILFYAGFSLFAGTAQAESTLDRYLKRNSDAGSTTKNQAVIAGVNKVYKSAEGYWRLDDTRSVGGFCAITYVAGAYSAGYVGPATGSPQAYIIFIGPSIPPVRKVIRKKMTLTAASDGQISSVPAYHGPNSQNPVSGVISFGMTSITEAVDVMSDVEELGVSLDGKRVFAIKWKGGHTARKAMQACLSSSVPTARARL
jgi:hypothetical protein